MKPLISALILCMVFQLNLPAQTLLNSNLSAPATIYLDFDGEYVNCPYWNNGTAFTAAAPALSTSQKDEIFNRVSEDYRPFDVNITTELATFLAAPIDKRMRVIVTPTSSWFTGVGGVAFVGSFSWGDDTPCFVFSDRLGNSVKYIAECCSHESGHTLGLSHQAKYDGSCNLTATYNEGTGTGEPSWAPIMGNSYYRNMSGWNNGPTPYGCSNIQDNLSIITTQNGFGYRADDFTDDINNNPYTINITSLNSINGIITTNSDKDAFHFSITENSNVLFTLNPFHVGSSASGANLDIKATLYDKNKNLLRIYDPANTMSVLVDTILNSGDYYLVIDGTGNQFTSEYGSLGSYSIEGVAQILPIRSVQLRAVQQGIHHQLNWDVITETPANAFILEQSADGNHFEALAQLTGNARSYDIGSLSSGTHFYRITAKAGNSLEKTSNIVTISGTAISNQVLCSFTKDAIRLQANAPVHYQLIELNGRVLLSGTTTSGSQNIRLPELPGGMYFLRTQQGAVNQTFRILH